MIGLRHINEARQAAGLDDLEWDEALARSAQSWVDKLASREVPYGYSSSQYPVLEEAIYKENTATDCVGQSFEATFQSAVGNWLHKWESEPNEITNTNHDACMTSIAEYVGCGKAYYNKTIPCTFYNVCFFGKCIRTPPSRTPPGQTPPSPKSPWEQHWGHTIYLPTPMRFTPTKDSEEGAKIDFADSET
ncbi:scp-like extracellular [Fusarium longipes]|uniref:Scp-like extracellular n=1 Tax=Fusarium longipes TaxID=694270 RepID=A0A395RPG1_9HYPO|nr:scp-like extracellular [Fusarium longipes]